MSVRDQYTQEQWDSLTEEEQEGILSMDEDETEEEEAARIAAGEGDKTTTTGKQADPEQQTTTQQQTTKTEPTEEEKAAAAQQTQQTTTQQQTKQVDPGQQEENKTAAQPQKTAPQPRGVIDATLPEDYDARVKANAEAQDTLDQKYEDGDISFAEYRKQQRTLERESRELERLQDRAQLSEESRNKAVLDHWTAVINPFTKAHPELSASQEAMNEFDSLLQVTTRPVLEAGGMPGQAEIDKAYRMWCVSTGHALPAAQQTTTTQQQKQPVKVPPTLGGLPSATQTGTEDGRWAQLDRLADTDPMAYEDALAKLSESDRDAYLSV